MEIKKNNKFNSWEISFENKPGEDTIEALHFLKFRWHRVKKIWYGFGDYSAIVSTLEQAGHTVQTKKKEKAAAKANALGVRVGDVFAMSWGYEQTNNDFFQVVELVGAYSVRVREVSPEVISSDPVCSMSENRILKITRDLISPVRSSIFIKDNEKGDLKRVLEGYGNNGPEIKISNHRAHLVPVGEHKIYESWYY